MVVAGQDRGAQVLAQGLGRHAEDGEAVEGRIDPRPEIAAISVGRDHRLLGQDRAAPSLGPPVGALGPDGGDGRGGEDAGTFAHGRPGQAAGIAERVQVPGFGVVPGAVVLVRARALGDRLPVPQLDRLAQRLVLLVAALHLRERARRVGGGDEAVPRRLTFDGVSLDEAEDQVGRAPLHADEARPIDGPEHRLHFTRVGVQEGGRAVPGVAARAAEARLLGLQHHHVGAALGQVQGRAEGPCSRRPPPPRRRAPHLRAGGSRAPAPRYGPTAKPRADVASWPAPLAAQRSSRPSAGDHAPTPAQSTSPSISRRLATTFSAGRRSR